jgi:hypothetical protein
VDRAGEGDIQRIGCAVSDDLTIWHRGSGRPLTAPDPRWNVTADGGFVGEITDPITVHWKDGRLRLSLG